MSAIVTLLLAFAVALTIGLAVARWRLAAELATTRRLFSSCMDLAPFCAYIKDTAGRYLYVNATLHNLMGRDWPHVVSFLGQTDHEIFPAVEAQSYVDDDQEVLRRRAPIAFREGSVAVDGTVRQWFSVKFPWVAANGQACVAGISIDTSAVRRAEAAMRASEDRCALALEAGRMGTLTLDLATQMLETSPLFAILHGRPPTKTRLSLEESLAEVHPDDHQSIIDAVHAALRDRAPNRITYRVIRPDGGVSWIELVGQVYCDAAGRPTVVRAVGFDVTERQAAYEELDRRKAMLRRLIEVQENERQTLCHELHDGMMQYAIGAKMLLEAARDESASPAQTERLESVLDCLTRGITEGRQVIRGVRSAVLDDLGLAAAIQDLADQMATLGIDVDVHLDADLDAMPASLRTTVYRVVQESLANVRKHAHTTRASVEVHRTSDEVQVRVSDAGEGFDVEEARKRGFGLVGMTERVRLAGGSCTIESRPGAGASIAARLPIPAASGTATQPRAFQAKSAAAGAAC
jgi:PAS domain S-box-containing protein